MRAADLITTSLLISLGGLVIFDAARLGIGWGADGPNSGFFPFWLAVIMIASCSVIFVQECRKQVHRPFVTRAKLGPVNIVLWPAVAVVAATHFIGLYLAAAIYLAFYMRWVGRHAWSLVMTLAIGIPLVTFLIFEKWFLVPMPKGPLEAWWGY